MKKKVLAWMLSVFMVITMMPLPAFATATETSEQVEVTQEVTVPKEAETDSSVINNGSEGNEEIATVEEKSDSWYDANATEYDIESVDDLKAFAEAVNAGDDFKGKTVNLKAELDLVNEEWTPIGYMGKTFKGTFNGHNNTIKNLKITKTLTNAAANNGIGLFGRTDSPAVIKNFTIENVDIMGSLYVGAVVGYGYTGNSVENVTVTGDIAIDAWWYAGVIGGNGYMSLVDNCHVKGADGSYIKGNDGSYIGGIWGFRGEGDNKITNCSVANIDISGVDRVGGICGIAHYGNTIENNGITKASVTATDPDAKTVGLIAGANQGGEGAPSVVVNNPVNDVTAKVGENVVEAITGVNIDDSEPITISGIDVTYDENGLITGGKFDREVPGTAVANDATITVGDITYVKTEEGFEEFVPVAEIGEAKYKTLQAAIDAAVDGDTVTLMVDCAEDVTVAQAPNVKITIDGNSKTMSGAITVDGKSARYDTAGVTIKNVKFNATNIDEAASINLGVSGNTNTRYTNHVTVQDCTFTGSGQNKVAIKSYTGGDKNLQVIGCAVDNTMHSLLQVTNVEEGLVIDGCTVESKNGVNLNSSAGAVIKNSNISVNGYAVRIGAGSGGNSGKVELTDNTLKTDNTEGDPVIEIRGAAVTEVELKMTENVVSGNTHISGTTADTDITADANYWDGKQAPVVAEGNEAVKVYSCYTDEKLTNLIITDLAGEGTDENPYLIETLDEFKWFRDEVNAGTTYKGKVVKLAVDLDLQDEEWTPIGTKSNSFQGTFDGQNYTISNLKINDDELSNAGLFGYAKNAKINNIKIENVDIHAYSNVGAVVGTLYTGSASNCHVYGNINLIADYAYAAGIVSNGYVKVSDCSVIADGMGIITVGEKTMAGGITGWLGEGNNGVFNCIVKNLEITAWTSVGAITGLVHYNNTINGCTVDNVKLTKTRVNGQAAIGLAAGNWSNKSDDNYTITITNNSFDNISINGTAINSLKQLHGSNYSYYDKEIKLVESGNTYGKITNNLKVGAVTAADLKNALAYADAGETVELLADIEADEVMIINKSVTINGNGHNVTSSASRVFRITDSDVEATLNDVNMISNAVRIGTNDVRGISIDTYLSNVELILNNSSVDFIDPSANDWAYAVNVSGNGTGHTVTVNGGTYEGANVINVHGANNTIIVKEATLNCTYPNDDMYAGACIWVLEKNGSSVEATDNVFNGNNAVAFNIGSGTKLTEKNNTDNAAYVIAKIGDAYYTSVEAAMDAATEGETITLLHPVTVKADETLILDKDVTIAYTSNVPGEDMFTNKGTMVVGGTTLVYVNTDATANNVTVSTISSEPGSVLEVKSGVVKNDSANNAALGIYAYAIDILTNGNLGDVTATISGGEVISTNYMAIRQFNNGEVCKNILNVTGGKIYGAKRAIQVHLKNNAAHTTISGGTIEANDYALCLYPTNAQYIKVIGGEFKGTVYSGTSEFISGGTFTTNVIDYLAEGFALEISMDDNKVITYGVIVEAEAAELEYSYTNTETGVTYYSDSKEALAEALGVNIGNVNVNELYLKQQIEELQKELAAAEASNAANKEALEKQIAELQEKLAAAESSNAVNKETLEKQIAELQEKLAAAESSNTADKEALEKQISGLEEALAEVKSLSAADKKALEDKIAELEKQIAELSEAEAKQLSAPTAKASNIAKTGKIKVTWDAVEGADEYAVYRSTSEKGSYKKMITVTGTSYTNTSAKAGTTYYYKVKALSDDKDVNNSELSKVVKRTCDLKRPVVTAKSTVKKQVKLTWKKVSGAKKYTVYRATSKNGKYKKIATTTKLSYTNKSLKAGKTYYYKVKAIAKKSAANSAFSVVDKCKVKR